MFVPAGPVKSEWRAILSYFRKIIYLSEYNGGECLGSIGFAKLSKKQTRLKIEIFLSDDRTLRGEKVYLLDKDKSAVNKVFFGTIMEDGKEILLEKNTGEAGMLKGQLAGVLIGGEGYVICAGTDDESVHVMDHVRPERETQRNKEVEELKPRKKKAAVRLEMPEKVRVAEEERKEEKEAGVASETREEAKEVEGAEYELKPEEEKLSVLEQRGEEAGPECAIGEEAEEAKESEPEKEQEKEKISMPEQEKEQEAGTECEPGKDDEPEEMETRSEREQEEEKESGLKPEEAPEEGEMIEVELGEEHDAAYMYRNLFANCPNMYPFEDDEMEVCVQISPADFSAFPKEYWHMGSNTFLLQGYYNYRHLILARKGNSIYVGVPGQYHRRDKYMADMFGFGHFKSILRKKERLGDFGYWMMEIEIPPSSEDAICVSER